MALTVFTVALPLHACMPVLTAPGLACILFPLISQVSTVLALFDPVPDLTAETPSWVNDCLSSGSQIGNFVLDQNHELDSVKQKLEKLRFWGRIMCFGLVVFMA